MGLSELKIGIVNKRIQQLEISNDGEVLSSDDAIFKIAEGIQIASVHPFLEATQYLLPSLSDNITFPCVNIELDSAKKIVDIELIRNKDNWFMLLFDFTEHYEASHPLVQEKNEASIAKNKLDFEKRLMQAKENFKNSFLANLNHEIRNPLNNMLGFINLLSESKLNYDQQETIKVIRRVGNHLKILMDDMLDISMIERGAISVKHVNFYLTSIVAGLQQHFSLKYHDSDIELNIMVEDSMTKTFIGDPVRLHQILFNLVENAYRNTTNGVVNLKISAEETKGKIVNVKFEISDSGKGIPPEALDKIFDSYYQLKVDREKPIGQGLGLKIVKDLVTLLNGTVSATSEEGKGSLFRCVIPFEKRKAKREKKTVRKGSGIFQSKRLLILEDETTHQMLLMKTFLNNEKGYVIEIATTGEQALEFLTRKNYNLVIIKKDLPDITGIDFIKKVAAHSEEEIASIPILMVSGSTMIDEQQEFLDAGATSFLPKPYSKKELFKCIEKLIR